MNTQQRKDWWSIWLTVSMIIILILALQPHAHAQPCTVAFSDRTMQPPEVFVPPPGNNSQSGSATSGQIRALHFLHGLGGTATSWNLVAARTAAQGTALYPARQVVYAQPHTYLQNGDLNSMGLDVQSYLNTYGWALNQSHNLQAQDNIMITHSLGGAVALQLDSLNSLPFANHQVGGYIFFGTGFQGVEAAHNFSPQGRDMASAFIAEGCQVLSDPDVWAYNRLPNLRWLPNLDPYLHKISDSICQTTGQVLLPFTLKQFNRSVVQEIKPNEPDLSALVSRNLNGPSIVVYGVEDEPVFWRTATSMYVSDSVGLALATDPFAMDDDQALVDWVQDEYDRFRMRQLALWQSSQSAFLKANQLGGKSFLGGWHYARGLSLQRQSQANGRAAIWYADANEAYKQMIGARVITTQREGYWCLCHHPISDSIPFSMTIVQDSLDCGTSDLNAECFIYPRWVQTIEEKPNDGLVLAESAGQFPQAVSVILMPSTNHQQMRNSSVTREVLKRIFNGQIPNGAFFITAPQ